MDNPVLLYDVSFWNRELTVQTIIQMEIAFSERENF